MPTKLRKTVYSDFRGGQNTRLAPYLLQPQELTLARNVWWDARGQIEKRPGYTPVCTQEQSPPSAVVHGMQMYYPEGSTATLMYWRNGALYRLADCSQSITPIASGYSASLVFRMENFKSKLFGVNGAASVLVTSSTVFSALGLTAPSSGPTASAGAAGVLTGTFGYKITYEYGTGDRGESNPSTAGSVVLAAQKGSLSAIPTGGTGVTKRHVYRTEANGATYYFVATISDNTTTVYVDNAADVELGDELETDNDAPPTAAYICAHKNMMFYAGNSSAPKRLYFSKIGNGEKVPVDYFIDAPIPGDSITGICSLPDGLLVFTNSAYYILTGASIETFRFRIVEPDMGLTAPMALTVYNGAAYFMYYHQVRRTRGGASVLLSDNIDNYTMGLEANIREARMIVWEGRVLLGLFLGSTAYASKSGAGDDTAVNNKVFMLDLNLLDQAEGSRLTSWAEWTNIFPHCWVTTKGPSQTKETLYWGSNRTTGLVYQQSIGGASGAFSDNGIAITSRVEGPDHAEGDPNEVKQWRYLSAICKGATGQTICAYYQMDQAGAWTAMPVPSKTMTANDGGLFTARWGFPGGMTGHYGRFAIEESSTSYLLIHSYHLHVRPVRDLEGR